MVLRAWVVAFLALSIASAYGQTYKWTDAEGKLHYGDQPPAAANATPVRLPAVSAPPAPSPRGPQSTLGAQPLGGGQVLGDGVPGSAQRRPSVLSTVPGGTNGIAEQEAAFQARRATRQRAEYEQANVAAQAKQKEAVRRAKETSEAIAKMKEEGMRSERAYNRNRRVTPDERQQDINRAYEKAVRRRSAGESTERTY
jgi:hypothetical protein